VAETSKPATQTNITFWNNFGEANYKRDTILLQRDYNTKEYTRNTRIIKDGRINRTPGRGEGRWVGEGQFQVSLIKIKLLNIMYNNGV